MQNQIAIAYLWLFSTDSTKKDTEAKVEGEMAGNQDENKSIPRETTKIDLTIALPFHCWLAFRNVFYGKKSQILID